MGPCSGDHSVGRVVHVIFTCGVEMVNKALEAVVVALL